MLNKNLLRSSLIAASISLVLGCSQKTTEEQLVDAQALMDKNDLNAAVIEVKNALKQDPNNQQARYLLGEIYYRAGSWADAINHYKHALDNGFEADAILPQLAQALYRNQDTEGLQRIAENSGRLTPQSQVIVQTFYALSLVEDGQIEKSTELLQEIVDNSKDITYSKFSGAILESLNSKVDDAMTATDEILAHDPELVEAIELKGHLFFSQGKPKEASEQFKKFLDKRPKALQARVIYASSLVASQQYDEAENQIDSLLKISKFNPFINQMKAQVLFSRQDYEQAYDFADIAIQNGADNDPISRIIAGVSAFKLGSIEKSYVNLVAVESRLNKSHPAYKVLAVVRLQLGYTDEAIANIDELENVNAIDPKFMAASSASLYQRGYKNRAKQLLDNAENADPNSAAVALQRGLFKFNENDTSAIDDLKRAIELDPSLNTAKVALAMSHVMRKEYDQAHTVANELASVDQVQSDALNGFISRLENKIDDAKRYLNAALAAEPKHSGALFNLGLIAEKEGDPKLAIEKYKTALLASPDHKEATSRLLQFSRFDEYQEDISDFFLNLQQNNLNNITATLALAEQYRRSKQWDSAQLLLNNFLAHGPRAVKIMMMKGQVLIEQKKFAEAERAFDDVIVVNPNNMVAWIHKIGTFESRGNQVKALQTTETALDTIPDAVPLLLLAANINLSLAHISEAKKYSDMLPESASHMEEIARLRGKIALAEDNIPEATRQFELSYEKNPNPRTMLELSSLLHTSGESQQALDIIEKVTESTDQVLIPLEMKRAEIYDQIDPPKAIEIYKSLAEATNEHFAVMNNLAWTYYKTGNFKDAETAAISAVNNAPEQPQVLDTYGMVLLKTGKTEQALAALEKSYKISDNPKTAVHLATALLAANKTSEAKDLLLTIDKQNLDEEALADYNEVATKL